MNIKALMSGKYRGTTFRGYRDWMCSVLGGLTVYLGKVSARAVNVGNKLTRRAN